MFRLSFNWRLGIDFVNDDDTQFFVYLSIYSTTPSNYYHKWVTFKLTNSLINWSNNLIIHLFIPSTILLLYPGKKWGIKWWSDSFKGEHLAVLCQQVCQQPPPGPFHVSSVRHTEEEMPQFSRLPRLSDSVYKISFLNLKESTF